MPEIPGRPRNQPTGVPEQRSLEAILRPITKQRENQQTIQSLLERII
jgi:hypothetical protein